MPSIMMTPHELAVALKAAADAHHEYEKTLGYTDADWMTWYANYMISNQPRPMPPLAASAETLKLSDM